MTLTERISSLHWLRTLPSKPTVVAELKLRSPYGWINPLSTSDAFDLCMSVGDVISIHTDEEWGGGWDHLLGWAYEARRQGKKVLAKGFHPAQPHVTRALDHADYCLTVGWWPGDERCWHEVETRDQLINSAAPRIVLNARDPRTGKSRPRLWGSYLGPARLDSTDLLYGGKRRWLCQASHVRRAEDVLAGMDAVLIGEGLYTSAP